MLSTGNCFHLRNEQRLNKQSDEAAFSSGYDRAEGGEDTFPMDVMWGKCKMLSFPGRFWRQVGGHLRLVECNNRGIVWGIGYDHTVWVYTGGYGGGFIQGTVTVLLWGADFFLIFPTESAIQAIYAVLPLAFLICRAVQATGHPLGRIWHCNLILSA